MKYDIPTYALVSTITFTVAFIVTLRSFLNSDIWTTCYSKDLSSILSTNQICNRSYIVAYFSHVESRKISLLVIYSRMELDRVFNVPILTLRLM
jgi:hypothetical protein